MNQKLLCIYHGNCPDGFAAAWAVKQRLSDGVEFYHGVHQQPPPETEHEIVVLVDFCYKAEVLKSMVANGKRIIVLDHHQSAQAELQKLADENQGITVDLTQGSGSTCWDQWRAVLLSQKQSQAKIYHWFDMTHSGAVLAWRFFHDDEPPDLIHHIEDGDLWRFSLANTKNIMAGLSAYPYEFAQWDRLMSIDLNILNEQGNILRRKQLKDINELLAVCMRTITIAGYSVPVASLPYTMASEAGHLMARSQPFSASYYDTAKARVFSLRSHKGGLNVAKIAMQYGGGGHQHAAGFSVPRRHPLAKV